MHNFREPTTAQVTRKIVFGHSEQSHKHTHVVQEAMQIEIYATAFNLILHLDMHSPNIQTQ